MVLGSKKKSSGRNATAAISKAIPSTSGVKSPAKTQSVKPVPNPSKKKDKFKFEYTEEKDSDEEEDEDSDLDLDEAVPLPDDAKNARKKPKILPEIEWAEPELMELISRIEQAIPAKDLVKFDSRVRVLDWDQVSFGDHTPEQCRVMWTNIQLRLRRYRILQEVLEDAKVWVTKPWTHFYRSTKMNRHPGLPKRPLSTYMLFYLEKKDKVAKENPSLEMTGVSKVIAEMYKVLSDKKKQKYTQMAADQRKVYEQKMEQFYKNHPDQVPKPPGLKEGKSGRAIVIGPSKPSPPFKLFCNDKLRKHKDDPNLDKTAFLLKCKEQWRTLSDKKKADYINRTIEEENKYQDEVKIYMADNPDFVAPTTKSILTKEERNLIAKVAGKPEKPPNSGYSLFSRLMLVSKEIKQTAPKGRMLKISELWKRMSEEDQNKYKEQVAHLLDQYKLEYATYLESLSEEKKAEELLQSQPKRKPTTSQSKAPPAAKRSKSEAVAKKEVSKETSAKKSTLYKNEPPQPPVNVCLLYLENFMKTAVNIPAAQREQKGLQSWQFVAESDKAKLGKELDERKQQYIKNFEQFLKSLSQEELKEYSMMKASGRAPAEFSEDSGSGSDSSSGSHSDSDSDSSDSGNEDASSFGDDN